MPPRSVSTAAARLAAHWVADALAADETIDFSVIKALLGVSPESLAGAPEAARERVALRCLQELVSFGGDAAVAAPERLLGVNDGRSCEELLLALIGEVGSSGSLEKDMLPSFSGHIQSIICIKKPALPETCFELLREVEPEITSIDPLSVEQNGPNRNSRHDNDQSLCNSFQDHVNIEKHGFPKDTAELQQENSNLANLINKTATGKQSPDLTGTGKQTPDLHQPCASDSRCYKYIQEDAIHAVSASAMSPEKSSNVEGNMSVPAMPSSSSGNSAMRESVTEPMSKKDIVDNTTIVQPQSCGGKSLYIQGDKSETNHSPGNTREHTTMSEQKDGDKSHMEVGFADKANKAQNMVHSGLNVQTVPGPRSCKVALHHNVSEAYCLSERNVEMDITGVQDENGKGATRTPNYKVFGNSIAETSDAHSSDYGFTGFAAAAAIMSLADKTRYCTKNKDPTDSLGGLSEPNVCIKCGINGQLLTCSSCFLAAHDSCFGSSATFEDSGQFYCPVCSYTRATEKYQKAKITYFEARKNLATFLGTKQLAEQQDKQPTGIPPRAANSKGHLSGLNSPKGQNNNQTEADSLAHLDEEPDRPGKRQKTNDTHGSCPEIVTEKASSVQTYDVAPMNKHSVLQNNSKQFQDTEEEQQLENRKVHEEAVDSGNSSHETRSPSQIGQGPSKNQEVETDKEQGLTNSHHSEDSDHIETTSDESGRSSSPWRKIVHRKAKLEERKTTVASNYGKAIAQQDQQTPLPSGKRNYAHRAKRYSNPIAPTGRRSKLCWKKEEEAALREAMEKFTPRDNEPIPWVQILEYRRDVFHKTRLPCDLRVKWRNMTKKGYS